MKHTNNEQNAKNKGASNASNAHLKATPETITVSDFIKQRLQKTQHEGKRLCFFGNGTIIQDQSGRPITNEEHLIDSLCIEIEFLKDTFEHKAREESALREELKACRICLKDEFRRTSDLISRVKILTETQNATGEQSDALQHELSEKVEGNHALLGEIRRLKGLLLAVEKKFEHTEKSLKAQAAENRKLHVNIETQMEVIKEQEMTLEAKSAENRELRDNVETQMEVIEEQTLLIKAFEKTSSKERNEIRHTSSNAICNGSLPSNTMKQTKSVTSSNSNEESTHYQEFIPGGELFMKRKRGALDQALRLNDCNNFTIRKLKQQNEHLGQRIKECESDLFAANKAIAGLHGIITGKNGNKPRQRLNNFTSHSSHQGFYHDCIEIASENRLKKHIARRCQPFLISCSGGDVAESTVSSLESSLPSL